MWKVRKILGWSVKKNKGKNPASSFFKTKPINWTLNHGPHKWDINWDINWLLSKGWYIYKSEFCFKIITLIDSKVKNAISSSFIASFFQAFYTFFSEVFLYSESSGQDGVFQ